MLDPLPTQWNEHYHTPISTDPYRQLTLTHYSPSLFTNLFTLIYLLPQTPMVQSAYPSALTQTLTPTIPPAIKMMWIYPHKGYTQCRLQQASLMWPFTYMVKIHTYISFINLQPSFPLLLNKGIVIICLLICSNLVPTSTQRR